MKRILILITSFMLVLLCGGCSKPDPERIYKDAIEKIENSIIKEVICTNSIPLSEENKAKTTKIKQLSVGLMLSKIIYAMSNHTPVSNVYNIFADHENI